MSVKLIKNFSFHVVEDSYFFMFDALTKIEAF